jgi:glycosyltransferase involved in cell wall biosynthesis
MNVMNQLENSAAATAIEGTSSDHRLHVVAAEPRVSRGSVMMVIHSNFPAVGGAEIQAARLSNALQQRGWSIRIIAIEGNEGAQLDPAFRDIPVTRMRQYRCRGLAGIMLVTQMAWILIRERKKYDVVHVHIMKTLAFVAAVVGKMLGKIVVLKVSGFDELDQGTLSEGLARKPYSRFLNWGCRKADVAIAVSRRAETRLLACGFSPDHVLYLPNGIDLSKFSPGENKRSLRKQLGVEGDQIAIYVGRLSQEKGSHDLLRAWQRVCYEKPATQLLIVGDGYLRAEMEAAVRADERMQSSVRFIGAVSDVQPYLAVADCYVCSSISEGLSNSTLEAMAAGLPIVTTHVSGAEDIVQNGENGYIVPVGNTDQLAAGICRVFSDLELARNMGKKSRALALDRFDMSRIVERYEHIYSGC